MALVLNDRVKETSTTTGTGTLDLAGASTGFVTFVAGIGDSNTTYYAIHNQGTAEWEVGLGTVTDATPDTLARTTVISNSSGNTSKISFSSGTKDVFCTLPAAKSVVKDASDNTNFADDEKIQLGTGNDIQLYHDGANSYFTGGTVGAFYIRGGSAGQGPLHLTDAGGGRFLVGNDGGATELYHNATNAKKLETIATGVQTTGTLNINAEYAFPTTDGNANQILETDGSGALTFVDPPSGGATNGFVIAMSIAL